MAIEGFALSRAGGFCAWAAVTPTAAMIAMVRSGLNMMSFPFVVIAEWAVPG
jgi:hypothetical protein